LVKNRLTLDHCSAILRSTPRFAGDRLIRSNLTLLMRRRQLKVAELARIAGVNRSAVTALANNRASRVELATLEGAI
jgi:predicted XRE-type DNA-binding protein